MREFRENNEWKILSYNTQIEHGNIVCILNCLKKATRVLLVIIVLSVIKKVCFTTNRFNFNHSTVLLMGLSNC